MRRDLPAMLKGGYARVADEGINPGASARGRWAAYRQKYRALM